MRLRVFVFALVLPFMVACATNPATGHRELSLVGEGQEVEMGKSAAAEVATSIGLYSDRALESYVESIGRKLAAVSERPNLAWSFKVADDPGVNAFALPGGYIYVTRGLVAHAGSEAQLAAVLGHEIGHVTARHSVSQISKAQLASFGIGLGMIVRPQLRSYGAIGQAGIGLLLLKYGRDDENEADELGLRYLARAGYRQDAMEDVMRLLERVSEGAGGGRVPGWLSTHPTPESRLTRIHAKAPSSVGERADRPETYLRRVDGLVYGVDPREGFVRDHTFYHPGLAFQIELPRDFAVTNTKQAVSALSSKRDAVVVVTMVNRSSPAAAAREFFAQSGMREGSAWRGRPKGAVANEFAAAAGDVPVRGVAAFLEHRGHVFQLLAYTSETLWSRYDGTLEDALASFRPLTDGRYLNVAPLRVEVTTAPRAMTFEELASRGGSPISAHDLALLNGMDESNSVRAGQLVKTVAGDPLTAELLRESKKQEARQADDDR